MTWLHPVPPHLPKQNMINHQSIECLTAVVGFLWRDEERTLLIYREKVTALLTAKDLAATRLTTFS